MMHKYQYKGFEIEVAVQSDFSRVNEDGRASIGHVVIVTVARMGTTVAIFSPLRLGDTDGRAFATKADALMTGYSAARRIVDDLLNGHTL
jgi:hypothetical protein